MGAIRLIKIVWLVAVPGVLGGCIIIPTPEWGDALVTEEALDQVRSGVGELTRSQIVELIGPSKESYADGRVVLYHWDMDQGVIVAGGGYGHVAAASGISEHRLCLQYSPSGVLELFKHMDSAIVDQDARANKLIREWIAELGGEASGYVALPSKRRRGVSYHTKPFPKELTSQLIVGVSTRDDVQALLTKSPVSKPVDFSSHNVQVFRSYGSSRSHYILLKFNQRDILSYWDVFSDGNCTERRGFCSAWGRGFMVYADQEADAAAKSFSSSETDCTLYVYTSSSRWFARSVLFIAVDGQSLGLLIGDGGFFRLELKAGTHTLDLTLTRGFTQALDFNRRDAGDIRKFHCEPGSIRFANVQQSWSNWSAEIKKVEVEFEAIDDAKEQLANKRLALHFDHPVTGSPTPQSHLSVP